MHSCFKWPKFITTKKVNPAETKQGVPLTLLDSDLKPWYSERTREQDAEKRDEKWCVSIHETGSIHRSISQLAARPSASMASSSYRLLYRRKRTKINLQKYKLGYLECTVRERAMEFIQRKKREMESNITPSAVSNDSGYSDVYNKRFKKLIGPGTDVWTEGIMTATYEPPFKIVEICIVCILYPSNNVYDMV